MLPVLLPVPVVISIVMAAVVRMFTAVMLHLADVTHVTIAMLMTVFVTKLAISVNCAVDDV